MAPALPPTLSRRHIFAPTDESATVRVALTGEPALVVYGPEGGPAAEQMRAGGLQSAAAAPVRVGGSLWGVVTLTSKSRTGVTEAMMARLAQFAELVEIAIGNSEARTDLELQATTDALSGLPNRRALERPLAEQLALAGTRGTSLSAVRPGYRPLQKGQRHLRPPDGRRGPGRSRGEAPGSRAEPEILARFGGEEFVWLLPETNGAEALRAAERAREAIAAEPFGDVGFLTISAGVCEQRDAAAGDPPGLRGPCASMRRKTLAATAPHATATPPRRPKGRPGPRRTDTRPRRGRRRRRHAGSGKASGQEATQQGRGPLGVHWWRAPPPPRRRTGWRPPFARAAHWNVQGSSQERGGRSSLTLDLVSATAATRLGEPVSSAIAM